MSKRPQSRPERRRQRQDATEPENLQPDEETNEESMGMADNASDTQPNPGQGDPAEAYVDQISQAEAVVKEEREREQQETERRRRVDEARRILARHHESVMKSDPQLSASSKEILTHSAYAAAATLVSPRLLTPFLSATSVAGIQLKMLSDMAAVFSVPFSESSGKALIASLTGSFGAGAVAGPTVAGVAMNILPIAGLASRIGSSALAFASTYAIGKVFQAHFASGGSLLNFDPIQARDLFRSKFQEGARMAPGSAQA